jgi:hypothetical protein
MASEDPPTVLSVLLAPFLMVAFTCGVIGSFFLWRLGIVRAMGARHVPFHLHVPSNGESSAGQVTVAVLIGMTALVLPVSLVLQAL